MSVASNWWEHFFEGLSVKLWLQALSPEHTASEPSRSPGSYVQLQALTCWMSRAEAAGCRSPWLSVATDSRAWTCRASSSNTHDPATAQIG